MIYRYDYSDSDLEYYEELNRCTINNDYVSFMTEDGIYRIGFHEIIRYIANFYEDCFIGNADDLCYYIGVLSDRYELDIIIKLVDGLDTDNEYFIVDYYNHIIPLDDMNDVAETYDVAEIISDMINRELVEDYCEKISEF